MAGSREREEDDEVAFGRRILVVALRYPPAGDAAAVRARNLVRNLQALSHHVRVVTPRLNVEGESPEEAHAVRWLDVEDLARSIAGRRPGSLETMSPPTNSQRRLREAAARLAFPDLYAPWIPFATAAARREVRNAELVISTGGASSHIVARLVRGSRPWIVDVNDLWWRKPLRQTGPTRDRFDRLLERAIVSAADALIVPVREQGLEIERRWGRSSSTVPTGFDPEDFSATTITRSGSPPREIVFAGTLYTFPLDLVFEALSKGRDELGWTADSLRLSFIGSCSGPALAAARARGVDDFVDGTPRVPRPELLDRLVAADALLLPLFAEDPHHLPMRFFEFVGAGRPIIGLGSANVPAARLVSEHQLGAICETPEELVAAFHEVISAARLPAIPAEARAVFETAIARPTLRHLIDATNIGSP